MKKMGPEKQVRIIKSLKSMICTTCLNIMFALSKTMIFLFFRIPSKHLGLIILGLCFSWILRNNVLTGEQISSTMLLLPVVCNVKLGLVMSVFSDVKYCLLSALVKMHIKLLNVFIYCVVTLYIVHIVYQM